MPISAPAASCTATRAPVSGDGGSIRSIACEKIHGLPPRTGPSLPRLRVTRAITGCCSCADDGSFCEFTFSTHAATTERRRCKTQNHWVQGSPLPRWPWRLAVAGEVATAAAAFCDQPDSADFHRAIDSLGHVVNRQGRRTYSNHGLHLDSSARFGHGAS